MFHQIPQRLCICKSYGNQCTLNVQIYKRVYGCTYKWLPNGSTGRGRSTQQKMSREKQQQEHQHQHCQLQRNKMIRITHTFENIFILHILKGWTDMAIQWMEYHTTHHTLPLPLPLFCYCFIFIFNMLSYFGILCSLDIL